MTAGLPLMIDLFGGEGIAALGYANAGFRVLSVENDPEFCDGCEGAYPVEPAATVSVVAIRIAAHRDGWATIGRGRHLRDICPECAPKVRP